jgi:hypothetical protein
LCERLREQGRRPSARSPQFRNRRGGAANVSSGTRAISPRWNCKRIRRTPCPEIINAIPATSADRFPVGASRGDSIVRLRPRRWRWWWRWWWWRRCWWWRSRRWRCEHGRRKRRGGRPRRRYDGKPRKHHSRRNSPAGPSGSGNARWRRPGRLKFRRSVQRKHGGRSGRDRGACAAHHQRSERRGRAKC